MLQLVEINVDGANIKAPKGSRVLDNAFEYGICIPHLCHIKNLPGTGACRLCVVEHVTNGYSKVTTSCTLGAEDGMVIRTNTDRIRKLRRNLAEILVAEAPNSRAVQDIAVRCGVKEVRYPFRNEQCILCGRCVQICTDTWRARAIGFVGRGKDRHVAYPMEIRPESCKQCYDCVELCPMTITPCDGPMKPGQEYLFGHCESQLMVAADIEGSCTWCKLGESFGCGRYG